MRISTLTRSFAHKLVFPSVAEVARLWTTTKNIRRPSARLIRDRPPRRKAAVLLCFGFIGLSTCAANFSSAVVVVPEAVLAAQQERVEAINRATPATIAIFDGAGKGGGSGVIVSPDGMALTNFHVVAPCGAAMKCGLPDGKLYDAVLIGIDPVGDVALIQLLGRDDFPTATVADSDRVRTGDWVFAAGNPMLLAHDYQPTITYGIVSGVHRYQYPSGTLLEYADCIQTDAAINPGNSGGPLYNAAGELIGINGRASFEKRGRVNVGVGYAITINQALRFLGHLKSGRIVDHASLGATVVTDDQGRVVVDEILESSDAYRRGLRYGDQIVRFADRELTSANALQNAVAVYPAGWPVSMAVRRDGETFDLEVRLERLHDRTQLIDMVQQERQKPIQPPGEEPKQDDNPDSEDGGDAPSPGPLPFHRPASAKLPDSIADRYEARRGFANYWYNRKAQERLWENYAASARPDVDDYHWRIAGRLADGRAIEMQTTPEGANMRLPWGQFGIVFDGDLSTQLSPPLSGGMLLTVRIWQRFLDKGLRQFGEVYYLGQLPLDAAGSLADCLVGIYAGMETKFFFASESGELLKIQMQSADDADPCELFFVGYGDLEGRQLPTHWIVKHGDHEFVDLTIESWKVGSPTTEESEGVQ